MAFTTPSKTVELSIYALESVIFDLDEWTPAGLFIRHEFWPIAHRAKMIDVRHSKLQPDPSIIHAQELCDLFNKRHPTMRLHYYRHASIWLAMDSE